MIRRYIKYGLKKGNIFMENNLPNQKSKILAECRKVAQSYGPYFGQQLFTIIKTNPDLKWKEDMLSGKNVLRQEVFMLVIKPIDVYSVTFTEKDLDGNPKIILNEKDNDPNLVFPLSEPDFSEATRATVSDCVDRLSKPNSKPMFFAAKELAQLTELVKVQNQGILNFYEEQANKHMKLADVVRQVMDQADRTRLDYMRQCGVDVNETEVRMKVEISE